MKRLIFLATPFLLMVACVKPSNEEKAKALIKEYILKYANDPKSYEAIEFGSLDSLQSIDMIGTGAEYFNLQNEFSKSTDMEERKRIMIRQHKILKDRQGFQMIHRYRASNAFGAKVLSDNIFYFNAGMDSVLVVRKPGE